MRSSACGRRSSCTATPPPLTARRRARWRSSTPDSRAARTGALRLRRARPPAWAGPPRPCDTSRWPPSYGGAPHAERRHPARMCTARPGPRTRTGCSATTDLARQLPRRHRAAPAPIDNLYSLVVALAYGGVTHQFRGDVTELRRTVDELSELCERYGFAYYREWALVLAGWSRDDGAGTALARRGIENAHRRRLVRPDAVLALAARRPSRGVTAARTPPARRWTPPSSAARPATTSGGCRR